MPYKTFNDLNTDAMALYREGLALARPLEKKDTVALCLLGLVGIARAVRQPERAARLLSAGETLLNTIGLSVSVWPEVRAAYEQGKAAARTCVSPTRGREIAHHLQK